MFSLSTARLNSVLPQRNWLERIVILSAVGALSDEPAERLRGGLRPESAVGDGHHGGLVCCKLPVFPADLASAGQGYGGQESLSADRRPRLDQCS